MIRQNLGTRDRILWIIAGIILIVFSAYEMDMSVWKFIVAFIGAMFFISGIIGWSSIYYVLGHSSRGYGIDRITKRDIEKAVKENNIESEPVEVIKAEKPVKKVAKKSTKKTAKKTTKTVKKAATKTTTKKTTKKSTTKKSSTKKTTKKTIKKASN